MRALLPALLLLLACGDDSTLTPAQAELRAAAEACLRRAGCSDAALTAPELSACVSSLLELAEPSGRVGVLGCARAAGASCPGVLACFNDGEASETCETSSYPPSCVSAVYHGCEDGREYASVCVAGTNCSAPGGPHWPCGIAACDEVTTPPSCDADGTHRLECEQTMLVPYPCPEGQTCVGGECTGTGEACNAPGGMSCDGDTLLYCANGHRATRDCALTGHTCGVVGGEPACTADQCSGTGRTASCSGTLLTLCESGISYQFRCGESGFGCCGAM